MSALAVTAPQVQLQQYQGKNRVVLVFTPAEDDDRFVKQQAAFEERQAELEERDIVILSIVGSNETRLRNQFRVAPAEFSVVLVGKDGGEKHRWLGVAPVEQLSHRIDRMPMRRVEMLAK